MDVKTYGRTDRFELELYAEVNPLLEQGEGGIDRILDALDAFSSDLLPDRIQVGQASQAYTRANVRRRIKTQQKHLSIVGASLSLVRSADPDALFSFDFKPPASPVGLRLWVVLPFDWFENDPDGSRAASFVRLFRALAGVCHPVYAWGHNKADFWLGDDPHKESMLAPKKVYEAYWLNYYGPAMVEEVGRERVLATPSESIEQLSDGGVLILTRPTPADYASEEARRAQARMLAHLRDDMSFDEALARLLERSARLAPVERAFDPSVAPLLELLLDEVPFAERQQETARLNAFHPPDVTEWRPADEQLPPDVDDVDEEIDRYSGLFAEQLAALLHKDVPSVMQGSPESLPQIDYHFYHFDFPSEFDRVDIEDDLVPAVGAYLGEVLCRNLGGRWVPRKNIDESQVIVGDRAWLPFLRARRYLHDRQSLLDYSLTQFFYAVRAYAG